MDEGTRGLHISTPCTGLCHIDSGSYVPEGFWLWVLLA